MADVERVAEVLRQKFGFTVQILRDAGKAQIVTALNALAQSSTSEDSVLIFYAGHGYLMDDIGMGFWIHFSVLTVQNGSVRYIVLYFQT